MSLELGVRTYKPENSELNTLNKSPQTPACSKPRLQKLCGGQALRRRQAELITPNYFFSGLIP